MDLTYLILLNRYPQDDGDPQEGPRPRPEDPGPGGPESERVGDDDEEEPETLRDPWTPPDDAA
ncbi:MAG: hypothetical protein KF819_16645 [Labilithrix sp.]|nr:hypothetical protein [Labilithrix sp.]